MACSNKKWRLAASTLFMVYPAGSHKPIPMLKGKIPQFRSSDPGHGSGAQEPRAAQRTVYPRRLGYGEVPPLDSFAVITVLNISDSIVPLF